MRSSRNIVDYIADANRAIQEAKTAQFAGNSQIVVKEFTSETVNTTVTQEGQAFAHCTVTAPYLETGNALVAYCVAKIMINGELIRADDEMWFHNIQTKASPDGRSNVFQVNIFGDYDYPVGAPVAITFYIYSATFVELEAGAGYA